MYQPSAKPNDPSGSESDRIRALLENLNNLRAKLKNFAVIDELGQPIGEIKDLILDSSHQLNLVIDQENAAGQQPSVLLNGRRIKKVSVQTQSVFVDITKADVRFLPEYFLPETPLSTVAEPPMAEASMASDRHAAPPSSQATFSTAADAPLELAETSQAPDLDAAMTADTGLALDAEAYAANLTRDSWELEPDSTDSPTDAAESTLGSTDFSLDEPDAGLPTATDLLDLGQTEDWDLLTAEPSSDEVPLIGLEETAPASAETWREDEVPNEARPLDEFSLSALDSETALEFDNLEADTTEAAGELEDLPLGDAWDTISAEEDNTFADTLPELNFEVDETATDSLSLNQVDFDQADFNQADFNQAEPMTWGTLDETERDTTLELLPDTAAVEDTDFIENVSVTADELMFSENLDELSDLNFDEPDLALEATPETNFAEALEVASPEAIAEQRSEELAGLSNLDLADTVPTSPDFEFTDTSATLGAIDLSLNLDTETTSENRTDFDWNPSDPDPAEDLSDFGFPAEEEPSTDALNLDDATTDNLAELDWDASAPPLTEDLSDFGFPAEEEPSTDALNLDEGATDNLAELGWDTSAQPLAEDLSDFGFPAADEPSSDALNLDEGATDNLAELGWDTSAQPLTEDVSDFGFPAADEPSTDAAIPAEAQFDLGDLDFSPTVDWAASSNPAETEADLADLSDLSFPTAAEAESNTEEISLAESGFELGSLDLSSAESDSDALASLSEINFAEEPSSTAVDDFAGLDFETGIVAQDEPSLELNLEEGAFEEDTTAAVESSLEFDFGEERSPDDSLQALGAFEETQEPALEFDFPGDREMAVEEHEESALFLDDSPQGDFPQDELQLLDEPLAFEFNAQDESTESDEPEHMAFADDLSGLEESFSPETMGDDTTPETAATFEFDDLEAIAAPESDESTADSIESLADLEFTVPPDMPPSDILELADVATAPSEEQWTLDLPDVSDDLSDGIALEETTEESLDIASEPSLSDSLDLDLDLDLGADLSASPLSVADTAPPMALSSEVEPPPPLNLDDLELSSSPEQTAGILEAEGSMQPVDLGAEPLSGPGLPAQVLSAQVLSAQVYEVADAALTEQAEAVEPATVDEMIPLLEERLNVEYQRRKVGEVIIRKQVETRMIEIPVRYEKLIIEQVSPDQRALAEVDLSQGQPENLEILGPGVKPVVSGEFKSPRTATYVLDAIAKTLRHRCKSVRIEVELEDSKLQEAYQEWLDQCSQL